MSPDHIIIGTLISGRHVNWPGYTRLHASRHDIIDAVSEHEITVRHPGTSCSLSDKCMN